MLSECSRNAFRILSSTSMINLRKNIKISKQTVVNYPLFEKAILRTSVVA